MTLFRSYLIITCITTNFMYYAHREYFFAGMMTWDTLVTDTPGAR